MKKNILFVCLAVALFVFAGCKKELDTYQGPTVVEFSPAVKSVSVGTVAAPGVDNVKVQLVGPQRDVAMQMTYTIDPSSTAVAGTHYNIPNSGTFTIPANSSFGYITVNLVPGSVPNAASAKKLVLKLVGNSEVPASANYLTYTLTITN